MIRSLLLVALLGASPLAAQSLTIEPPWYGPVPGARHAPIVKLSLGQLSSGDGVKHWVVGGAPVALAVLAFGVDSAAVSPSPTVVYELDRAANARVSGATFACKKPGDSWLRARWVVAGVTVASDSTVIRCHP